MTSIPSNAAPAGPKAVAAVRQAAVKQSVATADTPSVSEAEDRLVVAEDAEDKAETRVEKANGQIRKGKQQLAETNRRQQMTKAKLRQTRVSLENAEAEAAKAKDERDAAVEVRDTLRIAGTLAVDPATAETTGIDIVDVIPDTEAAPGEEIETAEAEATRAQAAYIATIAELCEVRLREGKIQSRAERIVRQQSHVESKVKAAKHKRQEAKKAEKSAEKQVAQAEEAIEQAHIAAERAEAAALASRSMDRPGNGGITSPYGMRTHPITGVYKLHSGTDFAYGDGIARAARAGTVASVTYDGAYGNMVTISHGTIDGDTIQTRYAHLASPTVSAGQEVSAGEAIGNIGSTGYATGPHLHFEVLVNGDFVDPMTWLAN